MLQNEKFLAYANKHYEDNKKKWYKYFTDNQLTFDEDVYSETILKVYDYLVTHTIQDDTDSGLANYWFKAFKTNSLRENQYSRNLYRDVNTDATEALKDKLNGDDELEQKIKNQVFDDWLVVQVLLLVEKQFDTLSFYCFRLYYILPKMTYHKLKEITKVKDCKKRVVTIKKWLKNNLDKHQVEEEFNKYYYGDN